MQKQSKQQKSETLSAQGKSLSIAELLHGTRAGRLQSVGVMQIIPLLSELEDDRFLAPSFVRVSTQGYGNLRFDNTAEKHVIIPCHAGYIVEEAAQDHAMAQSAVIPGKTERGFTNAMCIQQNQGGYISQAQHKLMILPYSLRESALNKRKTESFNKLWPDIQAWNQRMALGQDGNLVVFMREFKKQLDRFVAEFECVPQQIGAIILIGGEIVGIERAPSSAYFREIWSALIRECYGSEAIAYARQLGDEAPLLETRIPLRQEGIGSLEELAQALKEVEEIEQEMAYQIVRDLLDLPLQREAEDTTHGLTVETLSSERFLGQMIRDEEAICYASLFLSQAARRKYAWKRAQPFSL